MASSCAPRRAGKPLRKRMKHNRQNGFALLVVIWGLGVISLLVVSFMTTGRLRLQAAGNIAGAARAAAIVEGVSNLTIMRVLKERDQRMTQPQAVAGQQDMRATYDGAPVFCSFGGAAVAVAVEEEGGKVDLNAAAPELIAAVITGLGESRGRAESVAASIVAFRTIQQAGINPGPAAGSGSRPFPPKFGLFQTVMELDQVEGVDPALFRKLTPMFTVYSRNPAINPAASPPALFAALMGMKPDDIEQMLRAPFPNKLNRSDPRFPPQFKGPSESMAYQIRVEAVLPGGQAGGRETIIDLGGADVTAAFTAGGAYSIKEIRRAPARFRDALTGAAAGGLRPC